MHKSGSGLDGQERSGSEQRGFEWLWRAREIASLTGFEKNDVAEKGVAISGGWNITGLPALVRRWLMLESPSYSATGGGPSRLQRAQEEGGERFQRPLAADYLQETDERTSAKFN
jgi:hypothetical protein